MAPINQQTYTGRFAPSPTGPLHFGSLFAALASFLQARSQQGRWLLRIDDLDKQRNVSGADKEIIKTLETFGLFWDDAVFYQSQQLEAYQAALDELQQSGILYRCICSRKKLKALGCTLYPGLCKNKTITPDTEHALRIKTPDQSLTFHDRLQGWIQQNLARDIGDFIVKRKDGIIAYQLAVVVDDYQQRISQVVRGADLLQSTLKQIYLQRQLGYTTPEYMHTPIITDTSGLKLSKQTFARAVDCRHPGKTLLQLLRYLGQNPPNELDRYPVNEILSWAITHWKPEALTKIDTIHQN